MAEQGRKAGRTSLVIFAFVALMSWAQSPEVQLLASEEAALGGDNDLAQKMQNVLLLLAEKGLEAVRIEKVGLTAGTLFSETSETAMRLPAFAVKLEGDRLQVVLEAVPNVDLNALAQSIEQSGGRMELVEEGWIQAYVPVGRLKALAARPDVAFIRLPVRPSLAQGAETTPAVISEGVPVIGADVWQEAGFDGLGVKVGIIDSGFIDYKRLAGAELPPLERLITRSFRSDRDVECHECDRISQLHGRGVAEVVYDVAPGATFFLTNIDTDVSFRRAINWMIEQDVDVVNTSLGFPSGCFQAEQGIFASQLKRAREQGITWATAAGNEANVHWEGKWNDPDGNGQHNYFSQDEGNTLDVVLQEFTYRDGRRVATSFINVLYSWDAPCQGAAEDYEVLVAREDEDGQLVPLPPWDGSVGQLSDWIWQPGFPVRGIFASEDFDPSRVGEVVQYHLLIRKKNENAPDTRFDMLISCPCRKIQYLSETGSVSVTEPSISPSVITVGAVHHSTSCARTFCPDGRLLFYSSQGPTKDGRIKPDIAAPSHVSTRAFGRYTGDGGRRNSGFTGTSAASPHVAGAAALVVQALRAQLGRDPTPDEVQRFLEERAEDAGDPGKDNRYGAGILSLGPPPEGQTQPAQPEIAVQPESLTFSITLPRGAQAVSSVQTLSVRNAGGGTLVWEASTAVPWLELSPTSGTAPSAIAVRVVPEALSALEPRTHEGTITITSEDAVNSPVTVPVTLELQREEPPVQGELVAIKFVALEFIEPGDWTRQLQDGCVVYTNISDGPSVVRLTLPGGTVQEFEIPLGNDVIICGDVVHIDTRTRAQPPVEGGSG
jgi:subtilisin family serine protease